MRSSASWRKCCRCLKLRFIAKLQNLSANGKLQFKTELSLEDADKLKALEASASFEERTERSYPTGNLFSHIVGFANSKRGRA